MQYHCNAIDTSKHTVVLPRGPRQAPGGRVPGGLLSSTAGAAVAGPLANAVRAVELPT